MIGWADYLDGFAARLTGQYSRLGALLDPVIDRLLVISGMAVGVAFPLLPRWAIAVVIAREVLMLALSRYALRRGVELRINWPGRLGVAPMMGAPFFAIAGVHWLALAMLYSRAWRWRWSRPCSTSAPAVQEVAGLRRVKTKSQVQLDPMGARGYTGGRPRSRDLEQTGDRLMDTFPDLGSLTDQELKELIKQLTEEEMEISYKRRILHGKIDILRAELVNRLRKKDESGELVITGADVQQLTDILAGRGSGRRTRVSQLRWLSTVPSAASPTLTGPTTASAAVRSWPSPSRAGHDAPRPTASARPARSRRSSSRTWWHAARRS